MTSRISAGLVGSLLVVGLLCAVTATAGSAAANPVSLAAAATERRGSEAVTLDATWNGQGTSSRIRGTGTFDTDADRGSTSLAMTISSRRPDGTDDVSKLPWQAVFAGETLWLAGPVTFARGKHWLRVERRWGKNQAATDLAALLGQTPGDLLDQLRASSEVTRLGSAKVAGIATTRYRVAAVPSTNEILRQLGAVPSPIQVWIDGRGLVRKVRTEYTVVMGPRPSSPARFSLTLVFARFGVPVSATRPPAGDTLPANRFAGD